VHDSEVLVEATVAEEMAKAKRCRV
jgi:hypothetical protein